MGRMARLKKTANRLMAQTRERDVQSAVLTYLKLCQSVAWAQRMNTGQATFETTHGRRHVRFAFVGCADIIGQLKNGRFLAIEVKRPGGKPTPDQQAFIDMVNRHGGVAFVADCVATVEAVLGGKPDPSGDRHHGDHQEKETHPEKGRQRQREAEGREPNPL